MFYPYGSMLWYPLYPIYPMAVSCGSIKLDKVSSFQFNLNNGKICNLHLNNGKIRTWVTPWKMLHRANGQFGAITPQNGIPVVLFICHISIDIVPVCLVRVKKEDTFYGGICPSTDPKSHSIGACRCQQSMEKGVTVLKETCGSNVGSFPCLHEKGQSYLSVC